MTTLTAQDLARTQAQTLLSMQERDQMTRDVIAAAVDEVLPVATKRGPVDRAALIRELESMFSVWIGSASILDSAEGHVPWLPDAKAVIRWGYWERYRQYLANEQRWAPAALDELHRTTDDVLARLENPAREGAWDRRGLVVGHVQSGKTSNYAGLICKASDAGYRVIIVLAGLHNSLRSQTQLRLDAAFLGFDSRTSDSKKAGTPTGVGRIDPSPSLRPIPLTTSEEVGDFRREFARRVFMQPNERPILLVLKKNGSVLQNVLNWISDTLDPVQIGERKAVTRWPVLVIDDEADHASVDTREQRFDPEGTPDPDHDPTRINKLIRQILFRFQRAAYVGYTATPFANIFIHDQGRTADCGDDLFPRSFIVSLTAPSTYVGPVRVFGLQASECTDRGALGVTRYITDFVDDPDARLPSGWMPNGHKKEHRPRFQSRAELPPSLREAIRAFVLSCSARRARGQVKVHNSMLVHVTRYTDVQDQVREQIDTELRTLVQRLRYGEGDAADSIVEELKALWNGDFVATSKAVAFQHDHVEPIAWDRVSIHLLECAQAIRTKLINGKAEDILDYEEHKDGVSVIAVGGDKLARGLTLEGLTVSYYLRATTMYDTLMQMGRWFGYRPNYVDLCRLYLTEELQEWFEHVTSANEELRVEFDRMAKLGETPQAYGLRVQTHSSLLITSRVKMRSGVNLTVSFEGDVVETTTLETGRRNQENLDRAARFLSAIPSSPMCNHTQARPGGRRHSWKGSFVWAAVPGALVADFVASLSTHPGSERVNGRLLADFIHLQLEAKELTHWTVALLSQTPGRRDEDDDEHQPTTSMKIGDFEVGCSLRALLPRASSPTADKYRIRRLLSPRDEAIDLDAAQWAEALAQTKCRANADGGRGVTPDDVVAIKVPSGPELRQQRNPTSGLLLLYPLDPTSIDLSKLDDRLRSELDLAVPVLGFGISFPGSRSRRVVSYRVNNVYAEAALL